MPEYLAFLSHDWGEENQNHERVVCLKHALERLSNQKIWIDHDGKRSNLGKYYRKTLEDNIRNSEFFVVCVRQEYVDRYEEGKKTNDGKGDNDESGAIRLEYDTAWKQKKENFFFVVMDPEKTTKEWPERFRDQIKNNIYTEFKDAKKTAKLTCFQQNTAIEAAIALLQKIRSFQIDNLETSLKETNIKRVCELCEFVIKDAGGDVFKGEEDKHEDYLKVIPVIESAVDLEFRDDVTAKLLKVLRNVCRSAKGQNDTMEHTKLVKWVLDSTKSNHAEVAANAWGALRNLALKEKHREKFRSGFLEGLRDVLYEFDVKEFPSESESESKNVAKYAIFAISALAQSKETIREFAEMEVEPPRIEPLHKLLESIVGVLRKFKKSSDIGEQACRALNRIIKHFNPGNKVGEIVNHPVIKYLYYDLKLLESIKTFDPPSRFKLWIKFLIKSYKLGNQSAGRLQLTLTKFKRRTAAFEKSKEAAVSVGLKVQK